VWRELGCMKNIDDVVVDENEFIDVSHWQE
jgi:hypothetical protein